MLVDVLLLDSDPDVCQSTGQIQGAAAFNVCQCDSTFLSEQGHPR